MADASSYFNFYSAAERSKSENSFWLLKILQTLLLLLFMTLLTDLAIVMFMPDGLQILKNAYNQEVQYLSANIDPGTSEFISNWINTSYEWAFIKTGIHDYLYAGGNRTSNNLITGLWPMLQGATIGFQIFMIRLAVIFLMLPFLVLVIVVSAADGFLGWYLRRTSGARESGFIYHRSKNMVSWSIIGLWFIYLVPPFAIDPMVIFIPSVLLLSIFTRLSIQFFKKYV